MRGGLGNTYIGGGLGEGAVDLPYSKGGSLNGTLN